MHAHARFCAFVKGVAIVIGGDACHTVESLKKALRGRRAELIGQDVLLQVYGGPEVDFTEIASVKVLVTPTKIQVLDNSFGVSPIKCGWAWLEFALKAAADLELKSRPWPMTEAPVAPRPQTAAEQVAGDWVKFDNYHR